MEDLYWEEIAHEGLANFRTHRMCVSGGYIYRYKHNNEAHCLFVPNVTEKKDIEDIMAGAI